MEGELSAQQCSLDGAGHHGGMNFPDWLWEAGRVGTFGPTRHGFEFRPWFYLAFPYWAPLILSAALAKATWLVRLRPYRFTIRALLIATTLVAVVLGAIVWLSR